MSNRRKVLRQAGTAEYQLMKNGHGATDSYEWLTAVRQGLQTPDPARREIADDSLFLNVAEAIALATDATGRVTEDGVFDAMEVLGHPVTDRHKTGAWTVGK